MTPLLVLGAFAALLAAVIAARAAVDQAARWRHWRVGRWSNVLPGWDKARCYRCETSFRYAVPHDTKYETPQWPGWRECFPLCEPCWVELGTPAARLPYYERLFRRWDEQMRAEGMTGKTLEELFAIRAAVAAGL